MLELIPLDEAARQYDIWHRDNPKTEDRWISDKVLQEKAWDGWDNNLN